MNRAEQDYCIGRGLGSILAKSQTADNVFLMHAVEHNLGFLHRRSQGSTFLAISTQDLRDLPIPAYSFLEQRRIAEILSTIDEAIEQTEALIAKTQQIKAGLMHDLFTRGIAENGELRPPREEAPQLYKESPIGWIPKDWEVGHLRSKGSISRPYLKTGPFGSSLKIEHWVEEGIPVITIGALGNGRFVESELLYVSDQTAQRLREYRCSPGDIVFSRVADVGRSAVIGELQDGWLMSSNLMRMSLNPAVSDAEFLQAQLAYDSRVRFQIRSTVNSGGRDVANSATLNGLGFVWPPLEEQHNLVDRFRAIDYQLKYAAEENDQLRLIKHGLMQDLLTGRVRVRTNSSADKEGSDV